MLQLRRRDHLEWLRFDLPNGVRENVVDALGVVDLLLDDAQVLAVADLVVHRRNVRLRVFGDLEGQVAVAVARLNGALEDGALG